MISKMVSMNQWKGDDVFAPIEGCENGRPPIGRSGAACGADEVAVRQAVAALKQGKPVVFPTDTVYGVGLAVRYASSPRPLYELKRRDAGKPIAWLVGSVDALGEYGVDVPRQARELASAHWPGALTVIVHASDAVALPYRSQAGTIGLRMPAGQVALGLIREVGPLATTSANVSGGADPRAFDEVDRRLLSQVAAFVNADEDCLSGVASTVVDFSRDVPRVLRAGDIAVEL